MATPGEPQQRHQTGAHEDEAADHDEQHVCDAAAGEAPGRGDKQDSEPDDRLEDPRVKHGRSKIGARVRIVHDIPPRKDGLSCEKCGCRDRAAATGWRGPEDYEKTALRLFSRSSEAVARPSSVGW
jgi:hypothetical protein